MTAEEMWDAFVKTNRPQEKEYEAWAFGGAPDELAALVLQGEKTATSSAYELYTQCKEPLPKAGEYSVILNTKGEAVCVIRTTKVYVVPFFMVTEVHARKEGEGDKSIAHWRKVHAAFFAACLQEAGLPFCETSKVVCEEFKVVYQ